MSGRPPRAVENSVSIENRFWYMLEIYDLRCIPARVRVTRTRETGLFVN